MSDMDETTRKAILGEILTDELRAMHEYMAIIPSIDARTKHLEEDIAEVKSDIKIVKAAVTDLSHYVNEHGHDIRSLKRRAA